MVDNIGLTVIKLYEEHGNGNIIKNDASQEAKTSSVQIPGIHDGQCNAAVCRWQYNGHRTWQPAGKTQ